MFKQAALGEVKIGERSYQLLCAWDSPLGEIHDALMQMKGHCVQRIEANQKAEEAARACKQPDPQSQE